MKHKARRDGGLFSIQKSFSGELRTSAQLFLCVGGKYGHKKSSAEVSGALQCYLLTT